VSKGSCDRGQERFEGGEAVFECGGDVAADPCPGVGAGLGAEGSGDFIWVFVGRRSLSVWWATPDGLETIEDPQPPLEQESSWKRAAYSSEDRFWNYCNGGLR
jgi:hypothetical protein